MTAIIYYISQFQFLYGLIYTIFYKWVFNSQII